MNQVEQEIDRLEQCLGRLILWNGEASDDEMAIESAYRCIGMAIIQLKRVYTI